MGKYLILVMFAALSRLSYGEEDITLDHTGLADRAEYMDVDEDEDEDEDESLTLAPPTLQPGCVMLNKPVRLIVFVNQLS